MLLLQFQYGDDWDELKVAEVINQFRYEQESNLYESFPTMVAFGQHGAQSHYQPSKTTNSKLFENSTIVIDSGGQYRGKKKSSNRVYSTYHSTI